MNSIHFLIPKTLIALSYINIDPVLMAGFTSSQENFYGRLSMLGFIDTLSIVRDHRSYGTLAASMTRSEREVSGQFT